MSMFTRMRAQRELRKIQKEIEAFEKETKKTTDNFRRVTAFLGPNTNSNTNSNNTNSNRSNSTKINITMNNLERSIENNNKRNSNENDAMIAKIRKMNSNANTATFNFVDKMLNNTMHNHRAGVISTKQMQKNLAEYLDLIENRYRNSNRGLTIERKIRWYMGSKKIR